MTTSDFFSSLQATAFAKAIHDSGVLFPSIECVHVVALTLVVGSISIVDLRLLGVASANRSVTALSKEVLPITWIAFILAVLTGGALFASHAVGYSRNFQFRMKLLLIVLAGVNMLTFHWVMRRGTARWDEPGATPWQGKIAGSVSLALWIGIVAFGRWIGFASVR